MSAPETGTPRAAARAGVTKLDALVDNAAIKRYHTDFIEGEVDEDAHLTLQQLRRKSNLYDEEEEVYQLPDDEDDELGQAVKYWRQEQERLRKMTQSDLEKEERFALMSSVGEEDIKEMMRVDKAQKTIKAWIRFDMFFGMLVLLNGALAYLTTDAIVAEDHPVPFALELVFLGFFVLEWLVRYWFSRGFVAMVQDPWNLMDLVLITISIVDNIILSILLQMEDGTGLGLFSVVRVLRLLRLVRLIRLLRLMRELWVLVSGIFESVDLVLWGLAMFCIVCYIFALINYEILQCRDKADDPFIGHNFCDRSLLPAILQEMKIATYSGSPDVRRLLDGYTGGWILIVFASFIALASIGVLNLIIGVMLNTTIAMQKREKGTEQGARMLIRQKALKTLRQILSDWCDKQQDMNEAPVLSAETMQGWFEEDVTGDCALKMTVQDFLESGDVVPAIPGASRLTLGYFFEEAEICKQDIHTVFNELGSVTGSNHMTPDDFIEGCMWIKGSVHPLDVLNNMSILQMMYQRMDQACGHMRNVMHSITEISCAIAPLLDRHPEAAVNMKHYAGGQVGSVVLRKVDMKIRQAQEESRQEMKQAERIDAFLVQTRKVLLQYDASFGFVVAANAIYMGIDVTLESVYKINVEEKALVESQMLWMIWLSFEFVFAALFLAEIFVRAVFLWQIRKHESLAAWKTLPVTIFTLDFKTVQGVLALMPDFLREDHLYCFEAGLAVFGFVDSIVQLIFELGPNLVVVQVFRIIRMLRFTRLFYRGDDIGLLSMAFANNLSLMMWSFAMLIGVTYFFALVTVSLLLDDEKAKLDPELQKEWMTVGRAMLSMASIATFSDWTRLMESAGKYQPGLYVFHGLFVILTSIGILNLVTGVMVEAAFTVVTSLGGSGQDGNLAAARDLLQKATDEMFETSARLNKEAEDEALQQLSDLKQRCKKKRVEDGDAEEADAEEMALGESIHDSKNICYVHFCMWCSRHQVAIEFSLSEMASIWDPHGALLAWDGGSTLPSVVLMHDAQGRSGVLVFSKLPHHHVFNFAFQAGFSSVNVCPELVDWSDMHSHPLIQDDPVVKPNMTLRELNILLDDDTLFAKLGLAGIRADQALMVFQKLDVTANGIVSVDDFIDGMLRMKQPVQGLDVAASKSVTRRLVFESTNLHTGTLKMLQCMKTIVGKLRGISIQNSDDQDNHDSRNRELAASRFEEQTLIYKLQNEKMRKKIAVLQRHVEARKENLRKHHGDTVAFNEHEEVEVDFDEKDTHGWD